MYKTVFINKNFNFEKSLNPLNLFQPENAQLYPLIYFFQQERIEIDTGVFLFRCFISLIKYIYVCSTYIQYMYKRMETFNKYICEEKEPNNRNTFFVTLHTCISTLVKTYLNIYI